MSDKHYRLKNGRFTKKKLFENNARNVPVMLAERKESLNVNNNSKEQPLLEDNRIIDLKEFGKNLKCRKCNKVLSIESATNEKRIGLHSTFTIPCADCNVLTLIHTGKVDEKFSHLTAGIVLGK